MLEDIVAAGEGAVAPQVGAAALDLVAFDVLDDDRLDAIANLLGALHTEEAQRDELALGVLVADDEGRKAPRLQQVVTEGGSGLKLIEKGIEGGRVRQVGGRVAKLDDVVIGRVQYEQLGVRLSPP